MTDAPFPRDRLLGRHAELAAIGELVSGVRARRGGALTVQAEAGVGKTALLDQAAALARDRDVVTLRAAGAAMESQHPWGVVRQLFGPDLDPAARAELGRDAAGGSVPPFATFELLYWHLVELVDERPALLVVDDCHWLDEPSRRWLDYAARRLDRLPAGLLLGRRPEGPPPLTGRQTPTLHLPPLSRADVAAWLRRDHEAVPAAEFADEVTRLTGGNALLVNELLRGAAAAGLAPTATSVAALGELAPDGVRSLVAERLGRVDGGARRIATALAVLENATADTLAQVADEPRDAVTTQLARLHGVGLVGEGEPVGYLHPLLRTVVLGGLDPAERDDAHHRAALVLHARAAAPEAVAAQLVATRGDLPPWARDVLLDAAGRAEAAESLAAAVDYLRRVVESGADDAATRLRLGRALAGADPHAACTELTALLTDRAPGDERARVAIELSRTQRDLGQGAAAAAVLLDANADPATGPRLHREVELELLSCLSASRSARLNLDDWRRGLLAAPSRPGDDGWTRLLSAVRALELALDGGPRADTLSAAALALDGVRAEHRMLVGITMSLAGLAQMLVDETDAAAAVFDSLIEDTRTPRTAARHAGALAQRASFSLRVGRLDDAAADADAAVELAEATGTTHTLLPRAAATILGVAARRGTTPPLRWITERLDPENLNNRLVAYARAEVHHARGDYAAAAAAYENYGAMNLELGWSGVASPWRSQLAHCLVRLGGSDAERDARAADLASEELAIAHASGVDSCVGIALHAQVDLDTASGRLPVPGALERLDEARALLAGSPRRLEYGQLLVTLGLAQVRHGDDAAAHESWHEARAIAAECGATVLSRRVETLIGGESGAMASGSSPAPRALTRAERTVVSHAVAGLTNRQIARTLFVTEKTIEAHLRAAYRKLGVRTRAELGAKLG